MSPRPDKSKERKVQILDAAANVFEEKGIQKTRMDDIVEKSGLSKGTLYWYFKSKDEIILGIFDNFISKEIKELETLVSSDESSSARISTYTERIILDMIKLLRFPSISFEFLSIAFRSKYIQKAFKRFLADHMEILVPIIQQGVESGEFKEIDATEAAIAIGAVFEGTIALWVYDKNLIDTERHVRSGIKFLVDGFKL
ncbi:MAG: TetR/AcrR family transcriptional regulator [Anaerolineales bacterium]|nr:TetR/AcrR family transcriptional regulator [Chloroflexota bacterium]MBL6982947.1 TetR/AcrR family transcriptional regulator [Anaerolineales bacterium]